MSLVFSVIVPNYNYAQYLPFCLDSIKTQDYSRIEVLLADGASTDGSTNIFEEYAAECGWNFYSRNDKGQADAIQKGLNIAQGDIHCWLNSDDIYLATDVISKVAKIFESSPSLQMVSLGGQYFNENIEKMRSVNLFYHPFLTKKDIQYRCGGFLQPSTFWRKGLSEKYKLNTNYNFCFDVDFFIKICKGEEYYIDQSVQVSGYRLHGSNKSVGLNSRRILELAEFNDSLFGVNFRGHYLRRISSLITYIQESSSPIQLKYFILKSIYLIINSVSFLTIYRFPSI